MTALPVITAPLVPTRPLPWTWLALWVISVLSVTIVHQDQNNQQPVLLEHMHRLQVIKHTDHFLSKHTNHVYHSFIVNNTSHFLLIILMTTGTFKEVKYVCKNVNTCRLYKGTYNISVYKTDTSNLTFWFCFYLQVERVSPSAVVVTVVCSALALVTLRQQQTALKVTTARVTQPQQRPQTG